MSNRLYQNIITGMKNAIGRDVGIIDKNSIIIAAGDEAHIGESRQEARTAALSVEGNAIIDGYTYHSINPYDKSSLVVFVEGIDDFAMKSADLITVSISGIKELYDEKYDKNSFIKNIMLDNILPSDVYVKSKELQLDQESHHVVMIIKFASRAEALPIEIIKGMFPENNGDYVVSVGESDVILVKQTEPNTESSEFEALAEKIAENVSGEFLIKVSIGISSIVDSIKDLARAYKEARIALEVGKVFDLEKNILCYDNLGIGRLIYQLPTTLCEVFLQEVFKKGSLESLDPDTLMTVHSFFKNNLNVSETSRALFVHRNTLVYRLEKIRKITGLDLRKFDHAVTFKVALMVKKYLTNKPTKF